MKKIIFIIPFLFLSCTIKKIFKADPLYEKTLKHTYRCQINNSLETKALIDIVYLNPIYDLNKTSFLIGIYNNLNSLINTEYKLIINNSNYTISTSIPKKILYKNFPFYNSWMKYYFITTNKKPPLTIIYKSKHWGECKIKVK